MGRAHFEAGVAGHSGPLYNTSMGEHHPVMEEGTYNDDVTPWMHSLLPTGVTSNNVAPSKSKSGEKTYTLLAGNDHRDALDDFKVYAHPPVSHWRAKEYFPKTHDYASEQEQHPEHVQGAMLAPRYTSPEEIGDYTEAGSIQLTENLGKRNEIYPSLTTVQPAHQGQGLAMSMRETAKQFLKTKGKTLVSDMTRSSGGNSLVQKFAEKHPFHKNIYGGYVTNEDPADVEYAGGHMDEDTVAGIRPGKQMDYDSTGESQSEVDARKAHGEAARQSIANDNRREAIARGKRYVAQRPLF